jgi:assimilatory nitrate reductase catalytic subunit
MKGFIGRANIDTNSRLCMSSTVAGHKRTFGSDIVPACYEDFDHAELIILIGSNTAWCHPVSFQRIKAAKENNPALKVVVIDPRKTSTCDIADLHIPVKIGSDVALFNGLLSYLYQEDALDHAFIQQHTEGFEETIIAAQNDAFNIVSVAQQCEVAPHIIETFYSWYKQTEKTLSLYSQGVNQSSSGTDKVSAILHAHLATGRIGKPGCGPLSLTGQPNAMGGREVGGLANQLAAHMDFDAENIERIQRFWNSPHVADKPGYSATELFDAVAEAKVLMA